MKPEAIPAKGPKPLRRAPNPKARRHRQDRAWKRLSRDNLRKALAQVRRNKGAPGIDGMTVEALAAHLKDHWPAIRAQLLEGSYRPLPVKRVEIPKATGGVRALGIPTVLDRFIQQAVLQVLQAHWDGTFSASSYGFRPHRSAHQAVAAAQAFLASGHRVVVDIDIEKFFELACWYPPQQAGLGSKLRRSSLPALSFRNALSVRGTSGNKYSPVWASGAMAIVPL